MEYNTYIYALIDPRNNFVQYVGQSKNPKKRFVDHLRRDEKNPKKFEWVKELKEINLIPKLKILHDINDKKLADICEIELIKHYKQLYPILNLTKGGSGWDWNTMDRSVIIKNMTENNPMFNKEIAMRVAKINKENGTDERSRQRMLGDNNPAKKTRKPIIQFDINMNYIKKWDSAVEIQKELKLWEKTIHKMCKSENKIYKGFIWKYESIAGAVDTNN